MAILPEEFEQWGFRWPRTTTAQLPDGRQVTIEPTGYQAHREARFQTGPARKILRQYTVRLPEGPAYVLNEYRVEQLLGLDEAESPPPAG